METIHIKLINSHSLCGSQLKVFEKPVIRAWKALLLCTLFFVSVVSCAKTITKPCELRPLLNLTLTVEFELMNLVVWTLNYQPRGRRVKTTKWLILSRSIKWVPVTPGDLVVRISCLFIVAVWHWSSWAISIKRVREIEVFSFLTW